MPIDVVKTAKHLVWAEAQAEEVAEHGTAPWWAELISTILDELPPATAPRICELVIDYIIGGE